MRIIAGQWRGRRLVAPAGTTTRPTAERLRQAIFDMLLHAPWGGRGAIEGVGVLDLFAGTGAMGLEALSRGAAWAEFHETDAAALACLRTNIASCGAADLGKIAAADARRPGPGRRAGLVFLDPPYGQDAVAAALAGLATIGRIDADTLIVAELGRDEPAPPALTPPLADRTHGAGRVVVGRCAQADPRSC